ncbi:MAG: hypothetical protein WA820_10475 [Bradyrhizobium sp.]|jgi:hypothetical protein
MKAISILLAFAALITGLVGAFYWFKSSIVPIDRWGREEHPGPFLPHEHQAANTLWLAGMFEAAQKTTRLNKKAALWTAVAVILGAASSVFSSLA